MSVPFPLPKATSGKVILVATATAVEGRADECQKLVAAIRKLANSTAEPNTLTYRTTRAEGGGNQFVIFEEYVMPNGIQEHMSAEFKALGESGCVAALDVKYYEEFQ